VVTCEGGIYLLALKPLPSQNPRSPGTSPLGLTSLNRKNHPIEVTLGGIGSSYASLNSFHLSTFLNYKLCDNTKAASTAVYIQNKCPHKALEEKTLEEVFTGKKPSVDHLRIFDSLVYIHVPKEKRTKLEPSGKKDTFVGYSETSKTYRIYVPGKKFIEVSRDVTFHEEATFRCSREILV
jgi:hypothetical protein